MWRLYICGSLAAFENGCLQLFQILFSRDRNNEIPWTRNHIYEQPLGGATVAAEDAVIDVVGVSSRGHV
jgi:cyclopropane-fatty-acyl-phospholipid synthase